MKKLIDWIRDNWGHVLFAAAMLTILVFGAVAIWNSVGSHLNEARINKLETEKQQALKERDAARAQDLILQGKIEAKDEVIKTLTSQIAESNAKVINAHNETATAKQTYQKVRNSPVHFDSSDDAGRVNELRSKLRELYPDSP